MENRNRRRRSNSNDSKSRHHHSGLNDDREKSKSVSKSHTRSYSKDRKRSKNSSSRSVSSVPHSPDTKKVKNKPKSGRESPNEEKMENKVFAEPNYEPSGNLDEYNHYYKVVDIPIDHPSCSKQHAVLQYRKVQIDPDSDIFVIKPYLIDLDTVNGTFLNGQKMEPRRYYELIHKDIVKFAFSTREYVIINSEEDEDD